MTTLRGAIRSYSAAVKRAERAQQRNAREAARRFKAQQLQAEIENAAQAVENYNQYLSALLSVHKDVTDFVDWQLIANEKAPEEPKYSEHHEHLARMKRKGYRPSIFDKIFGSTNKKINRLETQIIEAIDKDKKAFELKQKEFKAQLDDFLRLQNIAKGVLNNDAGAYREAFEYFGPLQEISELGTMVDLKFSPQFVNVTLHVNNETAIPKYTLSQTARGKLSKKDIAISKFNELYQDHICSSVLRVVRECFAYLPINLVVINAVSDLFNSSIGRREDQTILSVCAYRDQLDAINFDAIDPSDCLKNFKHNMKFGKTTGFSQVPELDANTLMRAQ
ncbi:hypothetical protein ACWKWU_21905 [Chitinophaga lutea]